MKEFWIYLILSSPTAVDGAAILHGGPIASKEKCLAYAEDYKANYELKGTHVYLAGCVERRHD